VTTSIRRVVLASFIGTTIEWYDFFLYLTMTALVFNRLFFPSKDPFAAIMAAYGTNLVGFVARPLGGVIFGHFGDRVGRKSMLVVTLVLMGVATFLIGLLPTFPTIGYAAPALLVALRFAQGLGVGGEWGGAVLMAVEHSRGGNRGLHASWPQSGVPAGLLLANGVFSLCALMGEERFLAWGWRIPFLLGILLVGVGLFIRLRVFESPLFAQAQESRNVARQPLLEVLRAYPRNVLLAMCARFCENVTFYIYSGFLLTYTTDRLGLPKWVGLGGLMIASAVELFTVPLFGAISDRLGRRPVYLAGAAFTGLFAFPCFWLTNTREVGWIWMAIVIGLGLGHAAMYGPQAAFLSELFGTRVRYSGVSLGYQLASPLAGGLAPIIALALLRASDGRPWGVATYMAAMAAVTLVAVFASRETSRTDLEEKTPGARGP
jgi:metabolite-proton symporter